MAAGSSAIRGSRWARLSGSLTRAEWRRAGLLAFVVVALHVVGFGLLLGFVAPQHLKLGSGVFGIGVGITAYTLGMRHAFDADHIGAIDNTTRKLMSDGPAPAERRLLLLARPFQRRLPARDRPRDGDPRTQRRRGERQLGAA